MSKIINQIIHLTVLQSSFKGNRTNVSVFLIQRRVIILTRFLAITGQVHFNIRILLAGGIFKRSHRMCKKRICCGKTRDHFGSRPCSVKKTNTVQHIKHIRVFCVVAVRRNCTSTFTLLRYEGRLRAHSSPCVTVSLC